MVQLPQRISADRSRRRSYSARQDLDARITGAKLEAGESALGKSKMAHQEMSKKSRAETKNAETGFSRCYLHGRLEFGKGLG